MCRLNFVFIYCNFKGLYNYLIFVFIICMRLVFNSLGFIFCISFIVCNEVYDKIFYVSFLYKNMVLLILEGLYSFLLRYK